MTGAAVKPQPLELRPEAIPAELRALDRWVCWSYSWKPGNNGRDGKWTKLPKQINDRMASSTDPSSWTTFDAAVRAQAFSPAFDGAGVTMVPEDDLVGIDLDHCVTDGVVEPWAQTIVDAVGSYTEVSPSGTGLRIILRGRKPEGSASKRGPIECYEHGRYLTMTGHVINDVSVQLRQAELEAFLTEHLPPEEVVVTSAASREMTDAERLADEEILRLIDAHMPWASKFRALRGGDDTGHGGDTSVADLAFIGYLAYFTQDPDQLDRMYRASDRSRAKWDSKRGDSTWGARTIAKALASVTKTYAQAQAEWEQAHAVTLVDATEVARSRQEWQNAYAAPTEELPNASDSSSEEGVDRPEVPPPITDRSPTSWRPVDLTDVVAGNLERPEATILRRGDGAGLFYRGRFNMLFGASESAKTWITLVAEAEVLAAGGRVVHIDLESEQAEYVLRMRLLGTTDEALLTRIAYIYPDQALDRILDGRVGDTDRDLADALKPPAHLIVIDAMGELFDLHGLNPLANEDTPRVTRFLRKLATTSTAAVVVIDHVPKMRDGGIAGPIGAQAKRAAVTGAAFSCKASSPLAPGQTGIVVLRVDKDRPGSVRAVCPPGSEPVAARITLDAQTSTVRILATVDPPLGAGEASGALQARMVEVALTLQQLGGSEGLSKNKIREAVVGKATLTDDAVERLQVEGNVEVRKGARGALVHVLVRPYLPQQQGAPDVAL